MTVKRMPRQKPGRSKQDVQTPQDFLEAVKRRMGITAFSIDLAATAENTTAERFYTKADNALVQPWSSNGIAWLNPEFSDITPWVKRAWEQSRLGANLVVLVPAGVGSNWWTNWVHKKAYVLLLNGRITFVGHAQPYPKDCCLLIYGPDVKPAYRPWTWQVRKAAA